MHLDRNFHFGLPSPIQYKPNRHFGPCELYVSSGSRLRPRKTASTPSPENPKPANPVFSVHSTNTSCARAQHWSSVRTAAFRVARTRRHRRRQHLEVRPGFHLRRTHPGPIRRGRHGARPHPARSASDVWVTLRGVYYLASVMAAGRRRRGPLAGHRQLHDSEAGALKPRQRQ